MELDGLGGEEQFGGDVPVRPSAGRQSDDALLACGQSGGPGARSGSRPRSGGLQFLAGEPFQPREAVFGGEIPRGVQVLPCAPALVTSSQRRSAVTECLDLEAYVFRLTRGVDGAVQTCRVVLGQADDDQRLDEVLRRPPALGDGECLSRAGRGLGPIAQHQLREGGRTAPVVVRRAARLETDHVTPGFECGAQGAGRVSRRQ